MSTLEKIERLHRVAEMHETIRNANDENAYMSWIYVMPDEPDIEDFMCFVEDDGEMANLIKLYEKLCLKYGILG